MPKVNRLADLKRLPIGTRLRVVESLLGPVEQGRQGRCLEKVKSNALGFSTERRGYDSWELSWLQLPKASDFEATEDGFIVREDGAVAARYVFDIEQDHRDATMEAWARAMTPAVAGGR